MPNAFDYSRFKDTADRLISRYGPIVGGTLRRYPSTGPAWDPTVGAPQNIPIRLVVLDYKTYELSTDRVLATDKKVYIARGKLTTDPLVTDKVVIGGVEHSIVAPDKGNGIKIVRPGDLTLYYIVQCRL